MSQYDDDDDRGPLLDEVVERNSYGGPGQTFGQGPTVYENEQTYCQVRRLWSYFQGTATIFKFYGCADSEPKWRAMPDILLGVLSSGLARRYAGWALG
jgi:hypothetical protein